MSDRLPGHRDVWRIAAPMILSNVSVPLLGMVDTGVTGHLESPVYLGVRRFAQGAFEQAADSVSDEAEDALVG